MDRGYIKLWRKSFEGKLWQEKRVFCKFDAWLDIITEAQFEKEPKKVLLGLKTIECKRGQCVKSINTWGKRWNWSRSKVRMYFNLLIAENMIVTKRDSNTTILTVCNYDTYNDPQPTHSQPTANLQPRLKKERKKERKRLAPPSVTYDNSPDIFEKFWEEWPVKVNKQAALKAWGKIRFNGDVTVEKIVESVKEYKKYRWDDPQFIPHAATFINGERWNDEVRTKLQKEKPWR